MERGSQGKTVRDERMLKHTIDVVLWAIARRQPITRDSILDRWGVCRATAYRWLPHLEEARQRARNLQLPSAPSYRRPVRTAFEYSLDKPQLPFRGAPR